MIIIDINIIENLIKEACSLPRKRKNYNFHSDYSDPVNRMIHAMEPETYVQPHKHENPDKREVFIILKGKLVIVEFEDNGCIAGHFVLDPYLDNYGAEIPPRTWHSLIVLQKNTVVYEVKDGPYDEASDKIFAPWAPVEGSIECAGYNRKILAELGLL
jgi:cupin fold WbuC family metalloprotein